MLNKIEGVSLDLQFFAEGEEGIANLPKEPVWDENYTEEETIEQPEAEEPEADIEEDVDAVYEDEGEEESVEITPETSKEQSKDKDHPANKAFAELRRKAEEREREIQRINQQYAELGKKHGVNINSADEYYRLLEQQERAEQQKKLMEEWEMTQDPKILTNIVEQNLMQSPQVQQLNQQVTVMRQALAKQEYEQRMKAQIDEFNKAYNGTLSRPEDILGLPNAHKVLDRMASQNLSLSDAYLLENRGEVLQKSKKQVQQRAVNQAKGFSHVGVPKGTTQITDKTFTADQIKAYQEFFPSASREEAIKALSEL